MTCPEDVLDELGQVGDALKKNGDSTRSDGAEASAERPQAASSASERTRVLVPRLSDEEKKIYGTLSAEEVSIEAIAENTRLPAAKVASTLISLQLKGLARQLPGNLFVRTGRG